jgi:hypothetical protein
VLIEHWKPISRKFKATSGLLFLRSILVNQPKPFRLPPIKKTAMPSLPCRKVEVAEPRLVKSQIETRHLVLCRMFPAGGRGEVFSTSAIGLQYSNAIPRLKQPCVSDR